MFFAASALIFGVLGGLHLIYTLRDWTGEPRYFRPSDTALLSAMRETRTAIAPDGRDYWSGILGFHVSHSIGVVLFALLIWISSDVDLPWLAPVLILVGATYVYIAWRCWFSIPMYGALMGTVLMIIGYGIQFG